MLQDSSSSARADVCPGPGPRPGGPLRRLVDVLLTDRRRVWLMGLFQALQAFTYIPFTAAVTWLIDRVITPPDLPFADRCWLVALWGLVPLILWPIHAYCTVRAFALAQALTRATTARLRLVVVDQLQRMSLSFYHRRGAGALANQVTVDLGRVEGFLGNVAGNLLVGTSIGVAAAIYLSWLNWRLALIALIAVPIQMLLVWITSRKVHQLNQKVQTSGEEFSAKIVEFIGGIRLTKSLGNEEITAGRISATIEDLRTSGLDQGIFMRWLMMGVQFIGEYATTLAWCAAALLVIANQATIGQVVGFMGVLGFVRGGFQTWIGAYDAWQQARPGMVSLLELLDSRELEDRGEDPPAPPELLGGIRYDQVDFAYAGTRRNVLEGIQVDIPPGQRVGLVGEAGAGKSTFLDLAMGFIRPTAGALTYDGHPLSVVGLRHLRKSCAIMGQEAFLWNVSVRENIRFGRPGASDAEVEEAARQAQAHRFIIALESGYDSLCGERGGKLSGGQRQRIALARLFLRQPRFVVLDEPTSALDLETEARLLADLDGFCQGRTTFIVAHRLTTLRAVDRILVFSQGRIVEDGTPAELLGRSDGWFARLSALAHGGT